VQSTIDKGLLRFGDPLWTGGQQLLKKPISIGAINFEGKNVIVRPYQAKTTKGKNVVFGESRKKEKTNIKKAKPTFDKILAKYKEGRAGTRNRENRNFRFP
jgi:hypothetical protein